MPCSRRSAKVDAIVARPLDRFRSNRSRAAARRIFAGLCNKALGQVEIVRQGVPYVTDGGSFTLTTGVVRREPIRTGAAAALANGALEYFVPAAAVELPRGLRVNAVSPTVLREAPAYYDSFPGFIPVSAATVAEAYVRSIEGAQTGRIYIVD